MPLIHTEFCALVKLGWKPEQNLSSSIPVY